MGSNPILIPFANLASNVSIPKFWDFKLSLKNVDCKDFWKSRNETEFTPLNILVTEKQVLFTSVKNDHRSILFKNSHLGQKKETVRKTTKQLKTVRNKSNDILKVSMVAQRT